MSDIPAPAEPSTPKPYGIGGWLILPVIGLAVTPIRGLISVAQYPGLTSSFGYLGTAQSAFVVLEILLNILLLIVVPIYLLYLLFQKKRTFPRTNAGWGVASFVYILSDLLIAAIVFRDVFSQPETPLFDGDTIKEIFRALVLVAIWVPYMLNSRRVANTFTQ